MLVYAAPMRDMLYVLGDLLGADHSLADLSGLEDMPLSLASEVLEQAGRFCSEVVSPLNQPGDEQGCSFQNGAVRTPEGFVEAYAAFVDGGWGALSHDPAVGGQGLPRALQLLLDEMLSSSNFSFGLFTGLTRGAAEAIGRHATAELKAKYLPRLVSGEWTGAMALTEAHAGSDLGLLRTRAIPVEDGSYCVTGSKVFISAGDHDLTHNIVHLVLARLPDAPAGAKGISLFLVPKYLPGKDGALGPRNGMSVGSIEHKMGLIASPTCVMHYDGARGWLVGEPHGGLHAMFTMMNAERLFVGVQGLGVAEAAYQAAAAYARDRMQGQLPGLSSGPTQSILVHPDVRRMLLTIRAFTEAGRALAVWLSIEMDKAERHSDPATRDLAAGLVALLTPVVKAGFSDLGFESAVLAQQVLGGYGYVREWGVEQLVRDARIAQIYEGTNGIQALDLVGRKLFLQGGALPARFFALIRDTVHAADAVSGGAEFGQPLAEVLARMERITNSLRARIEGDASEGGAASVDYLRLMSTLALGWMWTRMALHTLQLDADAGHHHLDKLHLARFFFARVLPQSISLEYAVAAGAPTLMSLGQDRF